MLWTLILLTQIEPFTTYKSEKQNHVKKGLTEKENKNIAFLRLRAS